MPPAVSITGLSNAAVKYDPMLRFLPYKKIFEETAKEGIRVLEVANKHVETELQRQRGKSKPYDPDNFNSDTLGKFTEYELEVKPCYMNTDDNIKNYQAVNILNNPQAGNGDLNQKKKHPFEAEILSNQVKTVGEDILDGSYSGVRALADQSPSGMADGYDKKIDDAVAATTISAGNGNLVATGALDAPIAGDTLAIDRIIAFVRKADRFLRSGGILKMTHQVWMNAIDAFANKTSNFGLVDGAMLEKYINAQSNAKIRLVVSDYMGNGQRIHLSAPYLFDMGLNTFSDLQFVQVRQVNKDPNVIDYHTQYDLGFRIRGFNKKVFQVNELAASHVDVGGDYA